MHMWKMIKKFFRKIKHIFLGWFYSFIGRNYELGQERLKFCNNCPYHKQVTKRFWICDVCGCVTSKKVLVENEKCPNDL